MTTDATHVILGATLAGAKAAEALREEGFDGRIVLLGAEEHRPYERPRCRRPTWRVRTTGIRSSSTPPSGTTSAG
jgi:NADPH-dependent 2,4-dienoyl-CoA reductase/sulfur reductase-like enzyme